MKPLAWSGTGPAQGGTDREPMAVVDGGTDWALRALEQQEQNCHGFLDSARGFIPAFVLRLGDPISRRWMAKSAHPYLDEIDRLAARVGREGVYTLNLAYEWACLGGVGTNRDTGNVRFLRVLDYQFRGVGRHLVAVKAESEAGPWLNVTWPGYAGVVQACAPGRFAACLNQPPFAVTTGLRPVDWLINHMRIWRQTALPPEYLLRRTFETAADYWEARQMLATTPIARPAIFVLAGIDSHEGCVIERKEDEARIHEGPVNAGNQWLSPDWCGAKSKKRRTHTLPEAAFDDLPGEPFHWLRPPWCNWKSRLAMVADPATGEIVLQGLEGRKPVTGILSLKLAPAAEPKVARLPEHEDAARPEPALGRGAGAAEPVRVADTAVSG